MDNLYKKSKPDKKSEPDYLASGPYNFTGHVYPYPDWSLFWIENVTGVNWNIQLPGKALTEGTNVLVHNDPQRIILEVEKVLDGNRKRSRCPDIWDGHTAERVVKILTSRCT